MLKIIENFISFIMNLKVIKNKIFPSIFLRSLATIDNKITLMDDNVQIENSCAELVS